MADVALEADVSLMTVSNTFKKPNLVLPETRAKILRVAKRLGYVPNLVAANLASGRSRIVAAVVPSIRNSSFARTIQGLGEYLVEHDCELMLAVANTPERESQAVQAFLGRRPDGIILTGNTHRPEVVQLLKKAQIPVVETWILSGPRIDMAAGFHLREASYELTKQMVRKGYRHIGFASYVPENEPRYLQRQEGFQAALSEAGLRDDVLFYTEESRGFAGGRLAIEALEAIEPRLDAIFCATDILAAGAVFEAQRRGWRIPGDFGIAGFGDFDIASEIHPGLSTIRTHGYEIGQAAAKLVLDAVENRRGKRSINVGYDIVIRNSF